MNALTIWNPWASLISEGVKPVENRNWPFEERVRQRKAIIGTRIAIHAGKTFDLDAAHGLMGWPPPVPAIVVASRLVSSAILCTAVVDRFVSTMDSRWFCGPVGWMLRDVRKFEPVPCRGAQGLWDVPADVLALIPPEAR